MALLRDSQNIHYVFPCLSDTAVGFIPKRADVRMLKLVVWEISSEVGDFPGIEPPTEDLTLEQGQRWDERI